jgi:hypothetical protein
LGYVGKLLNAKITCQFTNAIVVEAIKEEISVPIEE